MTAATVIFKCGYSSLSTSLVAARIHLEATLWRDAQSDLPSDGLAYGEACRTR